MALQQLLDCCTTSFKHVQVHSWSLFKSCECMLQARNPTEAELKATSVVALELSEVSAKVRTGPAIDDKPDMDSPIWAGVLPFDQVKGVGEPQPDPQLIAGVEVPQYVSKYCRPSSKEVF